jgi:RNA polymerase sigma-70 factor (ECF subfamily)
VIGFDESFVRLHAVAYRAAYKLLGDRSEAEDVAQESMARAYARWRRVEEYADAWVGRVAVNLALDRVRSHDYRRRVSAEPREVETLDPDSAERIDLQRALLTLPRRQRDVVVLRYPA